MLAWYHGRIDHSSDAGKAEWEELTRWVDTPPVLRHPEPVAAPAPARRRRPTAARRAAARMSSAEQAAATAAFIQASGGS